MPGWLKVLLTIAIILVVLVVGVIGAGAFWWYRNKDAIIGKTKEIAHEAQEFGRNSDNRGCVDESVSRYKKSPGMTSAISTAVFMRLCLDASHATPGFCEDVPKQTEFIKSAQWRIQQCREINLESDSYCQQLWSPVQQYCEQGPRKSKKSDDGR
jgi:hypothetical protein